MGFAPRPRGFCLKERIPYYAAIPFAGLAVLFAARGRERLLHAAFVVLALIFTGSAGFGAYYAGVEWGFCAGPKECTGRLDHPRSVDDFLRQLQRVKVARCDAMALRFHGLSLAAWNALISAGLACSAWLARAPDSERLHVRRAPASSPKAMRAALVAFSTFLIRVRLQIFHALNQEH